MRYYFLALLLVIVAVVVIAGPRGARSAKPPIEIFPDMDRQPKYKAQQPSPFFADGRAERSRVDGTVPIGYQVPGEPARGDMVPDNDAYSAGTDYFNTGKIDGFWGDGIPFEVTPAVMARGQERYMISCKVCHGGTGAGDGIVKQYGFAFIASLIDERLRAQPDGEIFNTITHGKNTMMAYGGKISVKDRWAIVAYVRALQASQGLPADQVPADLVNTLENQ